MLSCLARLQRRLRLRSVLRSAALTRFFSFFHLRPLCLETENLEVEVGRGLVQETRQMLHPMVRLRQGVKHRRCLGAARFAFGVGARHTVCCCCAVVRARGRVLVHCVLGLALVVVGHAERRRFAPRGRLQCWGWRSRMGGSGE